MRRSKPRYRIAIAIIILMFLIIAGYTVIAFKMIEPDDDKICENVYVDQINVSGLTREQAKEALSAQLTKLAKRMMMNGQR